MPAARRKQSNAMLYTLIIFVGLFIVATTVAVFFYVKAEDYRTSNDDMQKRSMTTPKKANVRKLEHWLEHRKTFHLHTSGLCLDIWMTQ